MNIGALIHQALKLGEEEKGKRDYVGISQIGYCPRKVVLEHITPEKTQHAPKVLMKWLVGEATHEYLQSLLWKFRGQLDFKYRKSEKTIEIQLDGDYVLKGHADLIAEIDGNETVIDFKIYAGTAMAKINEPHPHYVDQLTMYAHGLGINHCELVYINKDDGDYKVFKWEADPSKIEYLKKKAVHIMKHIEAKEPPAAPYASPEDTWECGYCPFYSQCWDRGMVKSEDTIEIPEAIATRLKEVNDAKKAVEEEMDSIKGEIEDFLGGKKGKAPGVSAYFMEPKEEIAYDKKLLEANIQPEFLERCANKVKKKGYYVIKVMG